MIYFLLCGWPCRLFSIEIERACSCPMGGRCISVGMKQEWCFVLIPSTQRTTSWLRSSWVWCPPPWAETWLPGHFLCDIIKAYPWQQKPKVVPFLFHAPCGVGRLKKSHFKQKKCSGNTKFVAFPIKVCKTVVQCSLSFSSTQIFEL